MMVMVMVFAFSILLREKMMLIAEIAAFGVMMLTLRMGLGRGEVAMLRLILTGIAMASVAGAVTSIMIPLDDMRVQRVLGWLAGSTYAVTGTEAVTMAGIALLLAAAMPMVTRWIDILPLGSGTARALGINLRRSNFVLVALAAFATGAATLVVRPLSFAGLVAPHIARRLGMTRSLSQGWAAALIGAIIMVSADREAS